MSVHKQPTHLNTHTHTYIRTTGSTFRCICVRLLTAAAIEFYFICLLEALTHIFAWWRANCVVVNLTTSNSIIREGKIGQFYFNYLLRNQFIFHAPYASFRD